MVTTANAQRLRATARRIRANRAARRATPAAVSAVLVGAIALSMSSAGGTMALWNGSVTVRVPAITAGSVTPDLTGFGNLSTTFTPDRPSKTAALTLYNKGTVPALATLALTAEADTGLGSAVALTAWYGSCDAEPVGTAPLTAQLSPGTAYALGTWASNGLSTVQLPVPARGSIVFCVSSRVNPEQARAGSSVAPRLTVNMTTYQASTWRTSFTTTAGQSYSSTRATGSDYTDAVIRDGAAHLWRLSETGTSTLYDSVGSADAFGASGLTRSVDGAIGGDSDKATSFSGAAAATTRTSVAAPTSFSIEGWFSTTSQSGGKLIGFADGIGSNSTNWDRQLYLDGAGTVYFGVWTGSTSSVVKTSAGYNTGAWHYVVGTFANGVQTLYVDGQRVGFAADVTTYAYNGSWQLAGGKTWAGDDNFDGTADDFAVYGTALTAEQVRSHWNLSGKGPYPAGVGDAYGATVYNDAPDLFWRLGETSGTAVADYSGKGRTGTYSGMTATPGPSAVAETRNASATFAGTGSIGTTASVGSPQAYSLELWFNTTSTQGGKLIGLGSASSGNSAQYDRQVYLTNTGKLIFGAYPSSNVTIDSGARTFRDGAWHHVVATQSAAGMRLYVDGDLLAENATAGAYTYAGNSYWRVGGDSLGSWLEAPTSNNVTAKIDEVAVYTKPLTDAQIASHYSAGIRVPVATMTTGGTNYVRTFDASGSSVYGGSIASYSWTFSDGGTATGPSVSHEFAPGSRTATVTVTTTDGRTDTASRTFTVVDETDPTPPYNLTAYPGTTNAMISWSPGSDNVAVAGYAIYRNSVLLATVPASSYTFYDTGLTAGAAYTYTVRTKDTANRLSTPVSITTSTVTINTAAAYTMINVGTNQCATAPAFSGNGIALGECVAGTPAQQWTLTAHADGTYGIAARGTSLVWALTNGTVFATTEAGLTSQRWYPYKVGTDTYAWVPVSGANPNAPLCVGSSGANLVQQGCSLAATQQFKLVVTP